MQKEAGELHGVWKAAHRLANRTAPFQRQVQRHVDQQRTEAMLRNLTSAQEFLTPPPSSCVCPARGEGEACARGMQLLRHQKDGVRWLLAMHAHHLNAVVADEMGLGKTVQTMVFFSALAARGCFGTFLVVAPLTTLKNWAKETQTWVPWMHMTLFNGDADARRKARARLRQRHRRAFQRAESLRALWTQPGTDLHARVCSVASLLGGVVLASYEMVMADKGALARLLPWDVVVVDEAQRLKSAGCRLLRHLEKASSTAMRLILTGTPVQNNARELWTLMGFIAPEFCDDGDSAKGPTNVSVCTALDAWLRSERGGGQETRGPTKRPREGVDGAEETEAEEAEEEGAEGRAAGPSATAMREITAELRSALAPFLLRRTKATAGLALPPKLQVIVPTPLTPLQRQLYRVVDRTDVFVNNRMMHLRRCCLYPGPLLEQLTAAQQRHGDLTNKQTAVLKTATRVLASDDPYTPLSGKLQVLAHMLPILHAANHRVLLFSQFTSVLDALEEFLRCRLPSLSYTRLDGSTTTEDRAARTAQFQPTPPRAPSPSLRRRRLDEGTEGVRFTSNAENGVAEDDAVFATPPPPSPPTRRPLSPARRALFPVTTANRPFPEGKAAAAVGGRGEGERRRAFLCLLSTRTGGTGLNLTGADTVILFDGDFNPHNDRQAVDRCHRIGQRRPVVVYRLLCPATVEATQLSIARRKLQLERAVLDDGPGAAVTDAFEVCGEDTDVLVALPMAGAHRPTVRLVPLAHRDDALWATDSGGLSLSKEQLSRLLDRQWLQDCVQSATR